MIQSNFVNEWYHFRPFASIAQVEQDLIIERSIIAIYSNSILSGKLAFRGGTALHKLYLKPQARYSEDIDLIQLEAEPIKEILDHLRDCLAFLGDPKVKFSQHNVTMIYRFESEIPPVVPLKLKIEINTREHQSLSETIFLEYKMDSRWFSGSARIRTYDIHELLGSKLRALYQRRKGRDLFDLYYAIQNWEINPEKLLEYFRFYTIDLNITKRLFLNNFQEKLQKRSFMDDISGLLRPGIKYDQTLAAEIIETILLQKI